MEACSPRNIAANKFQFTYHPSPIAAYVYTNGFKHCICKHSLDIIMLDMVLQKVNIQNSDLI